MRTIGEHNGVAVHEVTLTSHTGVRVAVMSFGAAVRDWQVPDRAGSARTVTLGFDDFAPYPQHSRSFGIVAGRIANRVRDGAFVLDGVRYQLDRNKGAHHLHGGRDGLGVQLWQMEPGGASSVRLTHVSPDGSMGYPGTVSFTVDITLTGHALTFDMTGTPDRATPIALAQHSYYQLGGPLADHTLYVAADRITASDADKVTTGGFVDVADAGLDFRTARRLGAAEIDNNFCLLTGTPAAVLEGADFVLTLTTDQPGLQVYSAYDFPEIPVPGLGGAHYGPYAALALEAQAYPNAVNTPHFPPVIATPEQPYRQVTTVEIAPRP